MVGAVACSSSSSGGGATSNASGFIDSYCSYVASCCGAEGTPSDGSQCKSLLSLSGGTYDPVAGTACIDAVKKAAADDAGWCADQSSSDQAACNGAFKKTGQGSSVAPGGKCSSDSDCAAAPAGDTVSCRHYFGDNGAADADICQVEAPGKEGDSCNGSSSTSTAGSGTVTSYSNDGDATSPLSQITICNDVDGLTCVSGGGGYTCKALGAVGDDCQGGACSLATYCDYSTSKCASRLADGATCSSTSSCVAGDFCDEASSVCKKKLKGGEACSSFDACESNDCPSGTCSPGGGGSSLALAFLCGGSSGSN
ncbi:MAG: hypothetical protein ABI551_09870 [Polyangiaceae bacterium]